VARPVILDCDTGTDDALAIALAALHPDLDLLGVTTVWGNHEVTHTADNTLRVLDHLGFVDVPVHAGLAGPYAGRTPALPGGRSDLPPTLELPEPTRPVTSTDAVGWLVETLRAAPDPVALVATGPWSNVAAALARDPRLLDHVDTLVLLGGAHRRAGVTPWAERNVWCDPSAASVVLAAAGATTTVLVTMDATYAVPLDEGDVATWAALGTRAGTLAAGLMTDRIAWYRRDPEMAARGAAPLHDPLAVAVLSDPDVVTTARAAAVVESAEGEQQGRTRFDFTPGGAALEVALGADSATYRTLLTWAFSHDQPGSVRT
jgi:inosine-uridine nucleoside N-ribohydrolase